MKRIPEKIAKAAFPYILAAAVLVGGSAAALMVRGFLPDFDGGITTSDGSEAQGASFSDNVYPWNLFADGDVSIDGWMRKQYGEDRALYVSERISEFIDFTVYMFMGAVDPADGFGGRADGESASSLLMVHKDGGSFYFYIRNMPVTAMSGKRYNVSLVWRDRALILADAAPADGVGTLNDGEFDLYARRAESHLEKLRDDPDMSGFFGMFFWYEQSILQNIYGTAEVPHYEPHEDFLNNPAARLFQSIAENFARTNCEDLHRVYNVLNEGEYYTASIDGRTCVLMESEEYYVSLVLRYDGETDAFTGFSMRMK